MCRARRTILCLQVLFGLGTLTLHAEGLEENHDFRLAKQALSDGLPGVAATKANRLLEQNTWSSTDRLSLAGLAVESWVRAKDGRAALAVLSREQVPNQPFWEAQAQLLAGDLDAARLSLESRYQANEATSQEKLLLAQVWLATNQTSLARELLMSLKKSPLELTSKSARLMLDELDLNSGNYQPAVQDLDKLSQKTGSSMSELLRARGLVELGRYAEAESLLRHLISSTGGGERVHHSASVLLADTLLRQDKTSECLETLVQFLDNTSESLLWNEAFELLAKTLEKEPRNILPPDAVLRWMTEGNTVQRQALQSPPSVEKLQGHAILLMARWLLNQKRTLESLGLLEAMVQLHHGHPQGAEAMRLALETYGTLKADRRVTTLANEWRLRYGAGQSAMVDFVTGGTAYARNEYTQAISLFQAAANVATTLAERRAALYNAGVAALRAGELVLYQSILGQLEIVSAGTNSNVPAGDAASDLELDRVLDLAAKGDPSATDELRSFIQKNSGHPRLAQAHLALAETLLAQIPTDFPAIEETLKTLSALPGLSERQRQQAAITRMWMLDKQGQIKALTDAGNEFLLTWPESSHSASVRMKIADAYYRQENFASARTEFELVAKDYASSPYADTALYFAGMAAISMMSDEGRETAINLWQELAERGGPLSIPARQQQAMAKRRAGQEPEALKLLDSLLTEKDLSEDMRRSLLCERAEILMLLGKTDPAQLDKAVTTLREMLKENNLTYLWSARAGYTLAAVLKAAGRTTEALEACYDAVQASGYTGPSNPAEHRWFYRAGFFGIELLEANKEWESAARLAEKLALSSGERATEAKELATRIRLEHFLWDAK
ncbi:tetratricopeptide repeat protein [Prosthecobacter fusiformis]|uniref:Tetratricopeptide repeat protein n=1 Tax=Prosthecobacter fusiformis TaxID=48464 RepID=A0A4R7S6C2_9BACT|nr:outer membrane protein assembly factor BamD [Prosthecobacter fusiformis]TDU73108.1 tetratricopeptide repeat protein [Prosthecobacter fusiformis]